jgi:hypothetical protein
MESAGSKEDKHAQLRTGMPRVHVKSRQNEGNIRDGGKTVHIVFKCLSRSLL